MYDWNKPLLPGSVICSKYNCFDGENRVGIFVVLYDEQSDIQTISSKNIIAVKLSSKNTCVENYAVEINKKSCDFLQESSICCCSKIHVLHKQDQVYKILGQLPTSVYKSIYKTFTRFQNVLNNQMLNYL